jgi:hypothetical protein
MEKDYLILRRASASRSPGEWNDDDFDVLANGEVVGRIFKANAAPVGSPWVWTLAFGYHRDRARLRWQNSPRVGASKLDRPLRTKDTARCAQSARRAIT